MKQTLILGNIITMDEKRPTAKAALVKDGVFAYIGTAEEARELAGKDAAVLDYGENFVYPGFLESHAHPYLAGDRAVGMANLDNAATTDYEKCRRIINEFIEKNPHITVYRASGWAETPGNFFTKAFLDEICPDKPLIMHSAGGHYMSLNSKALEFFDIDKECAAKYGPELVHVDANGEPDGYISELPVQDVVKKLPRSMEEAKEYLLAWQDIALSHGFTGAADAAVELFFNDSSKAYHELEEEGRLKLRTYAYLLSPDNVDDPTAEVARIAKDRAKYSGEYFQVVGVKTFLDGVVDLHTGWQLEDYADQPGWRGLERFNNHDKMVELIVAADAEGLSVHAHSMGDGATHFMLDCIEDAEKITGDKDQRNGLAHLEFVTDEDIRRMTDTGSIPNVPPLWASKENAEDDSIERWVGKELAKKAFPVKAFYDAGANVVFHSDYPVSPLFDIKLSIYMAATRAMPEEFGGIATELCPDQAVDREQALRAMTINVARAWHQEHSIGSIEFGKLANMTVFDCDFLHDDIEKVAKAKLIATLVDGGEVYKA